MLNILGQEMNDMICDGCLGIWIVIQGNKSNLLTSWLNINKDN